MADSSNSITTKNPFLARLLAEGMNSAPIQSPWQGMSRLAHALLAGLEMRDIDGREKASIEARKNAPWLRDDAEPATLPNPATYPPEPAGALPGSDAPIQPNAVPTMRVQPNAPASRVADAFSAFTSTQEAPPQTGPRPGGPVPSTGRVWGDAEAEAAGLYPPTNGAGAPTAAPAPPSPGISSGPRPQMAQYQPSQPAMPSAMPPGAPSPVAPGRARPSAEVRAYIQRLYATRDPKSIALADTLSAQYAKPPTWDKLDDSTLFDKSSGRTLPVSSFRPLVDPTERARFGIPADDKRPYQVGPNNKLINPPPETRLNIDQRQETAFTQAAGRENAQRYSKIAEQGYQASAMVGDLNTLREIGGRITTGKTAQIKEALGPWASVLDVKIDGLDDLQAYKAIVARMAPRMRIPGSGAQSDFELRQFLEQMPSLGRTPGGNEIVANTLQALAEHQRAAGDIASRALAGELKPRDAERLIRELPDPMTMWRKSRGASPAAPAGAARTYDPATRTFR